MVEVGKYVSCWLPKGGQLDGRTVRTPAGKVKTQFSPEEISEGKCQDLADKHTAIPVHELGGQEAQVAAAKPDHKKQLANNPKHNSKPVAKREEPNPLDDKALNDFWRSVLAPAGRKFTQISAAAALAAEHAGDMKQPKARKADSHNSEPLAVQLPKQAVDLPDGFIGGTEVTFSESDAARIGKAKTLKDVAYAAAAALYDRSQIVSTVYLMPVRENGKVVDIEIGIVAKQPGGGPTVRVPLEALQISPAAKQEIRQLVLQQIRQLPKS